MRELEFAFEDCVVYQKMLSMWRSAKSRAKDKGRTFSITLDDLFPLYVEVCPILGIDIKWDNKEQLVHGSPSLDRVDNTRGYEKDNVHIISHRANALKKDYLYSEWEKMAKYMQSGGGIVTITDEHFKEPVVDIFDEDTLLSIRRARRRGESIEEIADGLLLPITKVARYISQVERFLTAPHVN